MSIGNNNSVMLQVGSRIQKCIGFQSGVFDRSLFCLQQQQII